MGVRLLTVQCRKCRAWHTVDCTEEQYLDWKQNHRLIQDAMPDVKKQEREMLISGYCDPCFQALFRDDDD